MISLVLLWLACNSPAQAGPLGDRLAQFPDWTTKPPAQPAQGDLIYPDWFAGSWRVTTTLIDLAAPLAPEVITPGFDSNRSLLQQPIVFPVRFQAEQPQRFTALLRRPRPAIVSDRAFNGKSLADAYLERSAAEQSAPTSTTSRPDRPRPTILAVKVDPTNPNRQITLLRGDRQLVSTVTARATEAPTLDQFITTELVQQEFRGSPQVYFNEVENTTAYTRQADGTIVADQVTAIYLSPQDPDYFKAIALPLGSPRPVGLYRYRLTLDPMP